MNEENGARITGAIRALGPDKSRKNTVTWTLLENPDTNSGIPTLLQTAILLKRDRVTPDVDDRDGKRFEAALGIHCEADLLTTLKDRIQCVTKSLRGKNDKEEDVIFNPRRSRDNVKDPKVEDPGSLEEEDLDTFTKVVTLQPVKE